MRLLIGFSTSDWWVSRVIRFFTRASVSHTYIVIDNIPDVGHELYEAAWCGFRMSTREKLTSGTTRIVYEAVIPGAAVPSALAILRSWLNTPYDYRGLFGEAIVMAGRWLGKRWPNPWASPHSMFCSEAATYLLQYAPVSSRVKGAVAPLIARETDPETLQEVLRAPGVLT